MCISILFSYLSIKDDILTPTQHRLSAYFVARSLKLKVSKLLLLLLVAS